MGTLVDIPFSLVPAIDIQIDNSRANRGFVLERFRVLLLGQKLPSGNATPNVPVRVLGETDAAVRFGASSMLHHMVRALRQNNEDVEVWAIPQVDNVAGTTAVGSIQFAGTATEAGPLALYIGGERIEIAVTVGMTPAQLATAAVSAINAVTYRFVTAVVNGADTATVDLTALHKGEAYTGLDLRFSYFDGERLPAGLTAPTITALANGAGNPSMATAIAAFGDTKWHTIISPYADATSLTALKAEMDTRFGPTRQQEGVVIVAAAGTVGALLTLGAAHNSRDLVIVEASKAPRPTFTRAARVAAVEAMSTVLDPARPYQTLALKGELAPAQQDRLTRAERQQLLADGVATTTTDASGEVRIERLVTSYKMGANGLPDPSYRDLEVVRTVSFLRFDLRGALATTFPRHKLADDDTRIGDLQNVMTPSVFKAFAIGRARLWQAAGLVEGIDQFIRDLRAERDAVDPDRLNALLRPDVVNQFRHFAGNVQFLR